MLHFSDKQILAEKYQLNINFKLPIKTYSILFPFTSLT